MRWLLLTTINGNPGDAFIRMGVERLIRQVDAKAVFILFDKLVGDHPAPSFDRAVLCGMPVFWSWQENHCWNVPWWKMLQQIGRQLLILGAGSFVASCGTVTRPDRLRTEAAKLADSAWGITVRDGIANDITGLDMPMIPCPATLAVEPADERHLLLCNLMPGAGHYREFGRQEPLVWDDRVRAIASQLLAAGFTAVCHSEREWRMAEELGFGRAIYGDADPDALLAAYGRCARWFGNRIHGAIAARAAGAATWCVGYDSRLDAARLCGCRVSRPSETTDADMKDWLCRPMTGQRFDQAAVMAQYLPIVESFAAWRRQPLFS